MTDTAASETLYINNLNEKIKVPELKKQLYNLFSQFGPILDVIASRTMRTRGQAWIVFQDKQTALAAKQKMENFLFYDKPMRVQFAKTKSDAIAKLDGTLHRQKQERITRRKQYESQKRQQELLKLSSSSGSATAERPTKRQKVSEISPTTPPSQQMQMQHTVVTTTAAATTTTTMNEPNRMLFIENLPQEIGDEEKEAIENLFKSMDGFEALRIIHLKGKMVAFAEFDNEIFAANAMGHLQGFMVKGQPMKITFANK